MKGTSTGQRQYDKKKAQKREMDRQRRSIHGDYSANLKPTVEQIAAKSKRDAMNAKEKARLDRKAQKRRKGRPKFDFECRACGFTTSTKSIAQTHIPKCKIQIALASMFSKNPYYDSLLACGYKERKEKRTKREKREKRKASINRKNPKFRCRTNKNFEPKEKREKNGNR